MRKTVFWDFDGTLVRSPSLWTGSVYKALADASIDCPWTIEDVRPHMQSGFPWHCPERDYSHLASGSCWWDHMTKHFSGSYRMLGVKAELADGIASVVRSMVLNPDNYALYPDAVQALQACLDDGWENHILSNNYPELQSILESLGIADYFSGITVSALVGVEKPRPEIFAAARAAAGSPSLCVMVGDNPVPDIAGANAAGMQAILVHRKASRGANEVPIELSDVPGMLRCINKKQGEANGAS